MTLHSTPATTPALPATRSEYIVRRDTTPNVLPNAAGARLIKQLSALRSRRAQLEASYAGAAVLNLFQEAPWLGSCALDFIAESEPDDEGGFYRTVSVSCNDAVALTEAELPTYLFAGGVFDLDTATGWIEGQLENDANGIYEAFNAPADYDDLALSCDRTAVTSHLTQLETTGTASGSAAFVALWPDQAHRVGATDASIDAAMADVGLPAAQGRAAAGDRL